MLKVKDLEVKTGSKKILRRVNLEIKSGEIHALLGPNGSGKTTLAHVIMGFPEYRVVFGSIFFGKKNINSFPIEKRAELGMGLTFQHPPVIKGITLSRLLGEIAKEPVAAEDFAIKQKLLDREINDGFSGGERKLSEIMQVISLNPKLVILDELDAGLDMKNMAKLTKTIKEKLLKKKVSLLLITHRGEILKYFEPHWVHVMLDGKIICSSKNWQKAWQTITKYDYEKCKECPFSTD